MIDRTISTFLSHNRSSLTFIVLKSRPLGAKRTGPCFAHGWHYVGRYPCPSWFISLDSLIDCYV